MNLDTLSAKIVEMCRRLHQRNMLAAADGNLSYRVSDDNILITPTGVAKAFMSPSEMAILRLDGTIVTGHPSSEHLMHLEVYRRAHQARAVIHAHPPNAIAWTLVHPELQELPSQAMSELILATGRVPIVPYARPGTQQMAERLRPFLPDHKVMILARHGALSWGENLDEAYNGMERVEHSAEILRIARTMGEITSLPADELAYLRAVREKMGNKSL